MQKFVPQSRILIFRNKQTWLTLLGPKLMFWCIWYYLGAFGTVWMPYKTRFKMSRSGEKVCAMKSCRNFSQRSIWSTPLDPNLMFLCISYYLGAFGTVWLRYKTQCKTGQISAKVRGTKSRRNLSQECTRDTPLDSKLIFWCVLYYLEAFGTVWLPYKTQCKTGWTSAKVLGTKSHHNFSQRTHPIDPVGI